LHIDDFTASPFHRFLGFEVISCADERAEVRLRFREEFLRQDGSSRIHGGVVASLIDVAGNLAVYSSVRAGVQTIDLRVDYLRPCRGTLIARSRAVRIGNTHAVADIEIEDGESVLVAIGRALFSLPPRNMTQAAPQK
jgi:uncharacterized protein (TIGR00369 family)